MSRISTFRADWIVMIWLVSTIVSFAVPPVSGGSLACIGVLLSQLGMLNRDVLRRPADAWNESTRQSSF